jgi:phosphoglycolate phosphatase-like HAD superfamily hydrolase
MFDFDGTLADTLGALLRIANRLAPEFKYQQIGEEQLARLQYLSPWEIMKLYKVSLWKLPFLVKRVKEEFPTEVGKVKLFPGVVELLLALKSRGYRLGIVSSNSEANIRSLLKQYRLEYLFDFITTGSTFGKGKTIERMMKQYNCPKSDAIYIGDEIRDIQAARSIDIRVIAVAWGFNAATALIDKQPDLLITKPHALLNALAYLYPDRSQQFACY